MVEHGGNAGGHVNAPKGYVDPKIELQYFDVLPYELRELVRTAPIPLGCLNIYQFYQVCGLDISLRTLHQRLSELFPGWTPI